MTSKSVRTVHMKIGIFWHFMISDTQTRVGQAVEVNISGKWRPGRIVSSKVLRGQPTKFKVKFDQHTQVICFGP